MQLITIGYVITDENLVVKGKGRLDYVERWLYAGGVKKFLSNIKNMNGGNVTSPFIISVVELGKVDDNEIEEMVKDGYTYMPIEAGVGEEYTLYKK